MKSNDRHDGMSSPTIPSITYDSLDDGKDCGPDTVYSIQQSGITSNKLRTTADLFSRSFTLLKHLSSDILHVPSPFSQKGQTHTKYVVSSGLCLCVCIHFLTTIPYAVFVAFFTDKFIILTL